MKTKHILKGLVGVGIISVSMFLKSSKVKETYSQVVALSISPNVPHDLPVGATEEDIANFAWNEFFALNWKAEWTDNNQVRVKPDTNWKLSSSTEDQPDLAVWETYIHRTELRPANGDLTASLETGKPTYTFTDFNENKSNSLLTNSNYWNVLDEDNEIGSAYLFAHENEYEVLYMAKTNLVEYNYLKQYFPKASELSKARNNLTSLSKQQLSNHYAALGKKGLCATDSLSTKNFVCLPCGSNSSRGSEGAIEIKMAFRKLDPEKDDASRFMTKEVVVFKKDNAGNTVASTDTFGVIGMHIIHKTENYPTFVFASWEQVDVRNNNMQTVGIDNVIVNDTTYADVDPHRLNPVIERDIPESLRTANEKAKALIKSQKSTSKWQYYQLIGAQAVPTDYAKRTDDSNYFMANYVIESDLTLTNFHGSFSDPFNKTIQNVYSGPNSYNMGGCMGCHGQAQIGGSDFSFLVDDDSFDTPDLYQTYDDVYNSTSSVELKAYTLSANAGWKDTGVSVKSNSLLLVSYQSGEWTANPNTNNGKLYGANGDPGSSAPSTGYPLSGAPKGALVGRIGNNAPFLIGQGPIYTPENQTGTLQLSINDDLGGIHGAGLKDNKGALTLNIIQFNNQLN